MPKQCNYTNCTNPVFSKGRCTWHQIRSVIKKSNPVKKVAVKGCNKLIKKVSDKRKKLDAVYSVMAAQFKKDYPYCMAKLKGCTGKADHTHHLYAGASRDRYYLDAREWINSCNNCHHLIHNVMSKEELYKLGLKKTY